MEGMDASGEEGRLGLDAPRSGRFDLRRFALWLPLCGVLGLLIAVAAEVAQRYFAPFLLFPLMVGVLLGGMLVGLLRVCEVGHRPTVLAGAVLAAVLAAAGQHYVAFWRAQESLRSDPEHYAKLRLGFPEKVPPDQWWAFMQWSASRGRQVWSWQARGAMAWATWGVDGLLVFGATLLLVLSAARLPYCNRCRRWYHTTQVGRIEPAEARQLAEVVDVTVGGEILRGRYRLIRCPGGCGPAGLFLSWEQRDGDYAAGPIWLGPAERGRVQELLDDWAAKRQADAEDPEP